ncbi:MAG: MFS transporter [Bacillota bacterium]
MKKRSKLLFLMYAAGYLGITVYTQVTVKWYQYFYTPPELNSKGLRILIPIGIIGLAMIVGRLFDGISDPLVAYYSDKSKHRSGRRIPFVLYGSLPLAVTFILLWFPPINGESVVNFIYLSAMLSLFFIFFTIVVAPYLALISDLTNDRKERINLTMMQGFAQIIGVMIAEVGSGALINIYGFRVMGLVLGILSFATIILTPIFIREAKIPDAEEESVASMGFFSSLMLTLRNKDFIFYLVFFNTVWFGINTLTISMPYITEILLKRSAESSGVMIAAAFILAIIFNFFIPWLVMRFGKKKIMMVSSILFALILFLLGFAGTLLSYGLTFAVVVLAGIPLAVIFAVPNAMIADIADLDSYKHKIRREGMFFGAQGLVIKIVIGLSSYVTPFLFSTFGYSAENPLGLQLCGPIAGVSVLLGMFALSRYSITEEQVDELHSSKK